MKRSTLFFILTAILFVGNTGHANNSCSDIFKQTETNGVEFIMENDLLFEFEVTKSDLSKTSVRSEANELVHVLVVIGNRIFDRSIDYIIEFNTTELPPQVQAQKATMLDQLIEKLQQTFEIGDNAMKEAIGNRVNNDVAELKAKYAARQERRAIGFGRDESAEIFHSDKGEKQPIGFGARQRVQDKVEEVDAEGTESPILGLEIRNEKELEVFIREAVEYQEVTETQPIGFVPPRNAARGVEIEKQPIGFIHSRPQSERITEENLNQIIFDIENGYFEFQKAAL